MHAIICIYDYCENGNNIIIFICDYVALYGYGITKKTMSKFLLVLSHKR